MIMTDDRHDYTCTDCRHTGRPCMEALWLGRQLTQSICKAAPAPDRDITSSARFLGCGFACEATVRINRAEVQIFCGMEDASLPSPSQLPRAMVLATPASQGADVAKGSASTSHSGARPN